MAQEIINNGTFDNDPSAEKIRTAFDKTNDNFTELYDDKVDKTGDTMTGDLRFNDATIIELGTNLASRLFSAVGLTRLDLFTDNFVIRDYTNGSLQGNRFVFTQAGNLGIGTLSPNTLLDVSSVNTGATAPTVRITNTLESSDWGGFTDDLGRFEFFTDDYSGNAPYTLGYVGIKNDRIATSTVPTGAMIFATTSYNALGGSVERMRINSDGDVGIGTTTPSEKLDVNGTVKATDYKGYLTTFQHGGFQHSQSSSSTTVYWLPTTGNTETTSSQIYNNWVAPYSGRVKKIIMRLIQGLPTATSVTFRKAINGTTSGTTYPATVTGAGTTSMKVERDFSSTDISFQAGDRVQFGFTTDGNTRLLQGFAYTIVLEYNKI